MRKTSDSIDTWPALADVLAGTTLIGLLVGVAAIAMLPSGEDGTPAARQVLAGAGGAYLSARRLDASLPVDLASFVTRTCPGWRQDARRAAALAEKVRQYERFGAVGREVAEAVQAALPPRLRERTSVAGGRIQVQADVLFASNSDVLQDSAYAHELGKAITQVLRRPELGKKVRYVIVQGHGDSKGSSVHNLALSTRRALSLVSTWQREHPRHFADSGEMTADACVGAKILVGGFGESRPREPLEPRGACTADDCAANRRVDIEIVPKQEEDRDGLPACP